MDIWNADKLTLFLVFFLPGFISIKVYDLMVPGERRDFSKSLFELISYSTLNFGALFWLIVPIQRGDFSRSHFVLFSLAVILIMVIFPVRVGQWFFWRFQRGDVSRSTFVHPIRKPWDYVFPGTMCLGNVVRSGYRCIFQSGQKILWRTLLNTRNASPSDPAEEQIYLQEVWILDEAGRFIGQVERSRGIIIMKSEIRAVEFFG